VQGIDHYNASVEGIASYSDNTSAPFIFAANPKRHNKKNRNMTKAPKSKSKPNLLLLSITALFREPKAREDLQLETQLTQT
jgi:hypothetical protein